MCAVLILAIGGALCFRYLSSPDIGETDPTVVILPNGQELYQQAANASDYYALTILTVTKTRVNGQTFTDEILQQYIRDGKISQVSEVQTIGDFRIESTLTYSDGTAYLALGDCRYSSQMPESEYQNRYAPLAMFDPTIYQGCQATYDGTATSISFVVAEYAEQWAVDRYDSLLEASGCAILNADNKLIQSSYTVQYRLGDAEIEKVIEVKVTEPETIIAKPSNADYLPLEDLDAPVALERACGFLLQAHSISSRLNETIVCEAFGDHRSQETVLNTDGIGDLFTAQVNISAVSVNSSRGGETTYKNQCITYKDKIYTIIENAGDPVTKTDIEPSTMQLYCQDNLVGTILLPEYITSVGITEENNRLYTFTANETLCQLMCQSVCQILYQSPDLLDSLASSHTTNKMEGYLAIDLTTGLPVSSGIHYDSVYIVDGFPYPLQYTSEQTYSIP